MVSRAAHRSTWIPALAISLVACEEVPRTYSTKAESGERIFDDDFNRTELGPNWRETGPGARIENGTLKLAGLRNHPLWLTKSLPDDLRVDFDAWADSDEGDIKVELAGDGQSHATSVNYVATGYVIVFGGWNNTLNVVARQNEHGRDRVTASEPTVEPGKRYHFTITRKQGELRWELNGQEVLVFEDAKPLVGPGQNFFAFGGWEAETEFDNLVVEAL